MRVGDEDGDVHRGEHRQIVVAIPNADGRYLPAGKAAQGFHSRGHGPALVLSRPQEMMEPPAPGDLEAPAPGLRRQLPEAGGRGIGFPGDQEWFAEFPPFGRPGPDCVKAGQRHDVLQLHIAETLYYFTFFLFALECGEKIPDLSVASAEPDPPVACRLLPRRKETIGTAPGEICRPAVFHDEGVGVAELPLDLHHLGPGLARDDDQRYPFLPDPGQDRGRPGVGITVVIQKGPVEIGEDDRPSPGESRRGHQGRYPCDPLSDPGNSGADAFETR